ncbi:hypothetical protein QQ045_022611 [Rhodiola kirilowii]
MAEVGQPPSEAASYIPSDSTNGVIFVGICLVIGAAFRQVFHGTRVPYTVALLIFGVGLGSLVYCTQYKFGRIGDGVRLWGEINPDLLLASFLPVLLFESTFAMDAHQIKKCMTQMILLAGPGVLISTCIIGSAVKLLFPYGWSWKVSFLLGSLLSATDPVAVVALLKELGASKKLSMIVEGESMMNDGVSMVVFQLFYRMVIGQASDWTSILKFTTLASAGSYVNQYTNCCFLYVLFLTLIFYICFSIFIGVAFGASIMLWLGLVFSDIVLDLALTLSVSYIAYFVAQQGADVSGILTVTTLGMFLSVIGRTAFKIGGRQGLYHFWEVIAYVANTVIFILSGVIIAKGMLLSGNQYEKNGSAWVYVILLYVIMQVARAIVMIVLYPMLIHLGYGMNWKEATIIVWSGLRGAVSLSMALSVDHASDDLHLLKPQIGTSFLFFTGGTVFLTLVVNGSTAQYLLSLFGMDKMTGTERCILELTKHRMLKKTQDTCQALLGDQVEDADWSTVKGYMNCVSFLESSQPHCQNILEIDDVMSQIGLKDTRVRFLNGTCLLIVLHASYLTMLNEGKINWTIANVMIRSVDEATDMALQGVLCDWEILKALVQFPRYYSFLQSIPCMQKLAIDLAVQRLQSACYICVAFLQGHKIARSQLLEFIGENEITSAVVNESESEEKDARKFLEDLHATFPQVLSVVKTNETAYKLLNDLCDYVDTMENHGLLEEKVVVHLRDLLQADMKKLSRHPPLLEIPKVCDLISLHPLLRTLSSRVRKAFESSMRLTVLPCDTLLCRKGCTPNGIWLLQNGVVKCDVKMLPKKDSFHLTFYQGSILGLYEVLARNPCTYDMITDTFSFCYFIDAKKFLAVLSSNLGVEDLFWKESLFFISSLMLSPTLKRMQMQEFRTLVEESLVVHTQGAGDVLSITNGSIGILLHGSVRSQDAPGCIIVSPALLLPAHSRNDPLTTGTSGVAESSFCHYGSEYLVETLKARIGVFHSSTLERCSPPSPAGDSQLT